MKIDCGIALEHEFHSTAALAEAAQEMEGLGFDGVAVSEMAHDPFLALGICAHETSSVELISSIAVALGRSPMATAILGHDLNAMSQGRFILGLGSQIKPHITKRYSMPWHGPAAQMREYIQALHAIWDAWYLDKPLDYQGEFYTHKIMTPEFTPTNIECGRPKVVLAAVGPLMQKCAAQVADGVIMHAFCTDKHLREVLLPKIKEGLAEAGRREGEFEVHCPVFKVTGLNEEDFEKSKEAIKYRIGFYASTPAYRGVLETHGWGDLQPVLHKLTRENKWDQLTNHISDEVLDAFAVVGEPLEVAEKLKQRYGGLVDRTTLSRDLPPDMIAKQLEILRS